MFVLNLTARAWFLLATAFVFAGSKANASAIPNVNELDLAKRSNSSAPFALDFSVDRSKYKIVNGTDNALHFVRTKELEKVGGDVSKLDLSKRNYPRNYKRSHFTTPLYNDGGSYLTDIYLGSNRQHLQVIVDTGSSDLWVSSPNVDCQAQDSCTADGSFDSSKSSTYQNLHEAYSIEYEDQSSSKGTWSKDTLAFGSNGSPSVTGLQFALVTETSIEEGILGISVEGQESSVDSAYPNTPQVLADQGVIGKNAYSVYLNSPSASSGTLLFGGYDTKKYSGSLVKLAIQSQYGSGFFVNVKSGTFNDGSTKSLNTAAVLDTGTTLTYLTQDFEDYAGQKLGGQRVTDSYGNVYYYIDCNQPSDQFLTYNLDGVSIKVPYSDLVIQSDDQCLLGILHSPDVNIFGDNFLRHAYVYYDITDNYVSIAQVKYTTASSIVNS